MTAVTEHPFGTATIALATAFGADGGLDADKTAALARRLVDAGIDGLVVAGTTGESPTTTAAEKLETLRAVLDAVGDRARITIGVGSYDTAESVELARQAREAGAHALLVVTPYYSRPSQAGLVAHFTAIADAGELPVMLYDIPSRSVVPIAYETIVEVAKHPHIVGLKEAKGDFAGGAKIISEGLLEVLSGDDPVTIPWISLGAAGVVSVVGHLAPERVRTIVDAATNEEYATARAINATLQPLFAAMARLGGVALVKAGLREVGFDIGDPRLPILPPNAAELDQLRADLVAAQVTS